MKTSSKAALLSGLIFPGAGHIFLKMHFRGSALVIMSAAALSALIASAYQRALLVVDRIVSGEVPMEAGAIAQAVSGSTSAADSVVENAAMIVLLACWLAGILDAYRLGDLRDRSGK